jgi:hypothetical protein
MLHRCHREVELIAGFCLLVYTQPCVLPLHHSRDFARTRLKNKKPPVCHMAVSISTALFTRHNRRGLYSDNYECFSPNVRDIIIEELS